MMNKSFRAQARPRFASRANRFTGHANPVDKGAEGFGLQAERAVPVLPLAAGSARFRQDPNPKGAAGESSAKGYLDATETFCLRADVCRDSGYWPLGLADSYGTRVIAV